MSGVTFHFEEFIFEHVLRLIIEHIFKVDKIGGGEMGSMYVQS